MICEINYDDDDTSLHKIPCVNTEKPMSTQDNISQSEEGCCKWETLANTKNSLCTQGNLCIDKTFFISKSYLEYTKVIVC